MAALFAAGAYVQLNDPDWAVWFAVYAAAATVAAHYAWAGGTAPFGVAVAAGGVALLAASVAPAAGAGLAAHGATLAALERVEEVREAAGLAILAGWLGVLASPLAGPPSPSPPRGPAARTRAALRLRRVGGWGGGCAPLRRRLPAEWAVWMVAASAPACLLGAWHAWLGRLRTTVNPHLPAHCNSSLW